MSAGVCNDALLNRFRSSDRRGHIPDNYVPDFALIELGRGIGYAVKHSGISTNPGNFYKLPEIFAFEFPLVTVGFALGRALAMMMGDTSGTHTLTHFITEASQL